VMSAACEKTMMAATYSAPRSARGTLRLIRGHLSVEMRALSISLALALLVVPTHAKKVGRPSSVECTTTGKPRVS
jgi:hypothetical protein